MGPRRSRARPAGRRRCARRAFPDRGLLPRHLPLVQRRTTHSVVEHRPPHGAGAAGVPPAPVAAQVHPEASTRRPAGPSLRPRFRTCDPGLRHTPRDGQDGTWILPAMVQAYTRLHHAGVAHSVETWIDGELAGGLYCINLGGMVYGESMFSRQSDASKIALGSTRGLLPGQGSAPDRLPAKHATPRQPGRPIDAASGLLPTRAARPCRALPPRWEFQPIYWQNVIPEHRRPA